MKKINKWIGVFILLFVTCMQFQEDVYAEGTGYFYENIHVDVQVNEQREYKITETLDVNFEQSMHGIIRDIPKSSDVESYEIRDVQVSGMPFEVQDRQSRLDVKIGDANTEISGRKTIILSYTLAHYKDYDTNFDYVYLNLLGNDYDSEIRHFRADITFPSSERLLTRNLTSGYKGSTTNGYTKGQVNNNQIHVESTKTIPPRNGVTLQLKFEEGVFESAPTYHFPYVINNNKITVNINEEQDFLVEQTIEITSNDTNSIIIIPMIQRGWDRDSFQVEDISCDSDVHKGEDSFTIFAHGTGKRTFELKYKVHPYRLLKKPVPLNLFNGYDDTKMEKLSLTLELPYAPLSQDYKVFLGREQEIIEVNDLMKISGNTIQITQNEAILSGARFYLQATLPQESFHRETGMLVKFFYFLSVGLVFLLCILRFVVFQQKKLIVPVNFYPPKGMNPAEAGYIMDMKVSDVDITSLIFYWADKGYIKIHNIDKEYQFSKEKDMESTLPAYERQLFKSMFAHGIDGIVTKKDLEHTFYADLRVAKRSLMQCYKGDKQLRSNSVECIRKLCMVVSFLPLLCIPIVHAYAIYGSLLLAILKNIGLLLIIAPMVILMNMIQRYRCGEIKKTGLIVSFVLCGALTFVICLPFFIIDGYDLSIPLGLLFTILALVCSYEIQRNSEYRNELLSSLLGFKDFIKTAEIERLELLLKDDPAYYYHILPYAQVLHVSDIWKDKFNTITMEAPSWYESSEGFHDVAFYQFINTLNHSVSSAPRASSSYGGRSGGGGFSSGGGSFSSGGSSGGGSGGGGSRGW